MPKIKSNKAAAKRFKSTKTGKFKRGNAFARHLMTGKNAKRRRRLRKSALLCVADAKVVHKMLPYGSR